MTIESATIYDPKPYHNAHAEALSRAAERAKTEAAIKQEQARERQLVGTQKLDADKEIALPFNTSPGAIARNRNAGSPDAQPPEHPPHLYPSRDQDALRRYASMQARHHRERGRQLVEEGNEHLAKIEDNRIATAFWATAAGETTEPAGAR